MSTIREIEVKGWVRDGIEQWTIGLKCDCDSLQPEIPQYAVDIAGRTIESAKAAIRANMNASPAPVAKAPVGEPYVPSVKTWTRCPTCGGVGINHTSPKTGKDYQACFSCRVFLEPDGAVKEMGAKQ